MARAIRSDETVRVQGLAELRRELRRLDDRTLIDGLKETNAEVAQMVIGPAQSRAGGLGRMEARAAQSLTAGRQQASATISFGGARAPFAAGAEFGAIRWPQFRPWRGSGGGAGYWLYPTIRDETDRIVEKYGDAIERLTARAFPS